MQTPIEFLEQALNIHFTKEQQMQFLGLFIQSKEMEKQQIINAFEEGFKDNSRDTNPKYRDAEHYYNENFKNLI